MLSEDIKKQPKKLLVISSPSGGGKTTLSNHLMSVFPWLRFSVSCTTRAKRPGEEDGQHYYFVNKEEFLAKLQRGEFAESEEIFGNLYGTLKSEIEKFTNLGFQVLFDIDVKGALSIKKVYPDDAFLIFITTKNLEVLKERLQKRSTETQEQILRRLHRAEEELKHKDQFDYVLVNDQLDQAIIEIEQVVKTALKL